MSEATGTEALARGLADEGIGHAIAFPGSPATVLAQMLEREDDIAFRWAANENNVLSHAFGSAMAGVGATAIMKHVGVNVALDALHVMGVVHTLPAPLMLIEGADARPGSSQSAQDNRPVLAGSPNLLVLAPSTVQETYDLSRAGLMISRAFGMMTVLRGDARMFKATGSFERADASDGGSIFSNWPTRNWALATSARTYAHHLRMRRAALESLVPFVDGLCETWSKEGAPIAAIVAGHLGHGTAAQLRARGIPGMRLVTENPLPEARIVELLRRHPTVAVLEECLPHLEQRIREIAHRQRLETRIIGRRQLGDIRPIGWLTGDSLAGVIDKLAERVESNDPIESSTQPLTRVPEGLLAGRGEAVRDRYEAFESDTPLSSFPAKDPRGPFFDLVRTLKPNNTFIATDPGVTGVLSLADGRSDTKMHMGGAVPMAAGWSRANPEGLAVAVVGDTNLPHSEWLGIIESAAATDDMMVVIVDNGHSEMTQNIVTTRPSPEQAMASIAALGATVSQARATTDPTDPWADTIRTAATQSGLRVVWLFV